MLEYLCSTCGATNQCDVVFGGKRIVCPACHVAMTVPDPLRDDPALATGIVADVEKLPARAPQTRTADGAIGEGLPPLHFESPSIRKDAPTILRRWLEPAIFIAMVLIVVGLAIIGLVKTREAAVRTQSTNNLKQIALSCASFHDSNKRIPFNGADFDNGREKYTSIAVASTPTSGSWGFQIIPYIESSPIYFEGPVGLSLTTGLATYLNPARGRPSFATGVGVNAGIWSDYFFNIYLNTGTQGTNAWDKPDIRRKFIEITDGTSNTIFVGDGTIATELYANKSVFAGAGTVWIGGTEGTARGGPDLDPRGVRKGPMVVLQRDPPGRVQLPSPISWGGPFPQGGLMGMCDGTVHMFAYSMPASQFGAFLTPTNGEVIDDLP